MIPKRIHYCWFGKKELPQKVKACIESWKRYCPNYELVLWNEDNFDINQHPYMKEAYLSGKWAFVSDLARLIIVYEHGGVYLDTDVELIASLDDILNNKFFFAIEKYTNINTNKESMHIATGLGFGAEAKNEVLKALLDEYKGATFILNDGTFDLTPCPIRNTKPINEFGWNGKDQIYSFMGGTIYPSDFFCPEEFGSDITHYSSNTVSIHHYDASWKSHKEKIIDKVKLNIKIVLRNIKSLFSSAGSKL